MDDARALTETEPEHFDVLIVGAGLSGIGAAYRIQSQCPWATYAIFEARDAIGGTWDLFRYPGIRSDSDMHTLGYPFRPWPGEKSIADGPSILRYIRDTAAEFGIDTHIRFNHRILRADWSSAQAQWRVEAERTDTGERLVVTCSFLFSCCGYYRYDRGYLPDFPDMEKFAGTLVHPQEWPEDLDYAGKRVIVIGSGATAVTLVPAMAQTAAHVTMLQRSPTYMISVPTVNPLAGFIRRVLPERLAGALLRWLHALGTQGMYNLSRKRPQLVRRLLRRGVERQLPPGYDVETHFNPRYDPWDQRLCAVTDGDLFAAIRNGSASVVTDRIDRFTERGILLESGRELEADIIVTATGLELLFIGGMELAVDGKVMDVTNKLAYKGMMLEDVPNFAMAVGYTNASWTLKADLTSQLVARLLNEMRERGMRQATPVNRDPDVHPQPLLSLTSGYVLRAVDRFPKQGNRFPWRVYQSYLRDYRAMRLRPVVDEGLELSNPVPAEPVKASAEPEGPETGTAVVAEPAVEESAVVNRAGSAVDDEDFAAVV
ncbi:MAG: NAD(P)/FAD-dependent oxidoreductase [Acidimicrobiales bacterium]|nr:NAD(P)/FAD-dependent oxidoreductase [Acidimicrobiales bacterium]